MTEDIRWIQRFKNFQRANRQLDEAMSLTAKRALSDLEKLGVIQAFEYNYELAWNVLKDFFEYQGDQDIQGSRDAIRTAFRRGLIINGDIWMAMIKSRALTSHAYNEGVTESIFQDIIERYNPEFRTLGNSQQITHPPYLSFCLSCAL